MDKVNITEDESGVSLVVKVVPGSSRTEIAGAHDSMLKMKIAAPPEKGKANKMLIEFLAKRLNIKKNDIIIESGQTNPIKHVRLEGVAKKDVEKLLDKKE